MHGLNRYLITLLALLALAGAQVFGLQKGYLCDCSGTESATSYEFCNHDHGHSHDGDAGHHEHDHDHDNDQPVSGTFSDESVPAQDGGHTHEHAPLKVELTAAALGKDASAVSAFASVLAFPLPDEFQGYLGMLLSGPQESGVWGWLRPPDAPGVFATSVMVAECVVLRV